MERVPSLGIIVTHSGSTDSGTLFGLLTPYYRQLVERATALGWRCIVFAPRDVLRQRRTIWSWVRGKTGWERQFSDLPDVVYTRLDAPLPDDMAILRWLRSDGDVSFLNQPEVDEITADRWRAIQVLQSHPTLSTVLPDVALLRDELGVTQTHAVVVAPRYSIKRQVGAGYICPDGESLLLRLEESARATTRSYQSARELLEQLSVRFGEVIVEPYVEPLRLETCPLLIRALWQRDRTRQWQETAVMLLLGQAGSVTYQATVVGLLDRLASTLRQVLPHRYDALRYQLTNLGRVTVELLNQRAHGMSELTVDFIVTKVGDVHLHTVSTTSGLASVWKLATPTVAQTVSSHTLAYASTLLEAAASFSELTASAV
ncbi:hypothetical protein HY524_02095 [Candidatus Berkelbacteria bacterium]|nr:hypothetical protein [Candidatus Berkelbacteria bacterium]